MSAKHRVRDGATQLVRIAREEGPEFVALELERCRCGARRARVTMSDNSVSQGEWSHVRCTGEL